MSNYTGFEAKQRDPVTGAVTMLASTTIHVHDITNDAALPDVASDVSGIVAPGSVGVAAGTTIRFYIADPMTGPCFVDQVTT
jgi:hypothetical protein